MVFKKIAIFPVQSKSLKEEDIYFAKTLSLFIHLSIESLLFISSNLVRLIGSDDNVVSENLYIKYSIDELLNKYDDISIDNILFIDISNKKGSYIITYYLYDGIKKELKGTKNYILNNNLFEKTYKLMISDLLENIDSEYFIPESYLIELPVFNDIKKIIKDDDNFFYAEDKLKYIEGLKEIYFKYKEISILRYIVRKLLNINNIFFVNKIINDLKEHESKNDYILFLLVTTLMEFKQYQEALNLLDSIEEESVFFKLKEGIIHTIKSEIYLKLDNLKLARKHIMKSVKYRIAIKDSYELFLEIMYKSKFFLAFKSYLEMDRYEMIRKDSDKANYWIAKYYSEISVDNKKALSAIEDFKFSPDIIFLYIKILYRISISENNTDKLNDYIISLYNMNILEAKNSNNLEFVKKFIKIILYLKQENNLLSFSVKKRIKLIPYKEIELSFNDVEKIIFNYIYENTSLDDLIIKKLLFFILGDYSIGIEMLHDDKGLYFYCKALVDSKKRLKYLKRSLKIKMEIPVLNKVIIYYNDKKNYFGLKKFLNIRKKYIENDEFYNFYMAKLLILGKKYKKALKFIDENDNSLEILKSEIYFYIKEYDKMLDLMKKHNNEVVKDSNLSYLNGLVLLKIKNSRKGLFYLQNSYNLKPNKILQKRLIKEYKRYGINYSKE